MATTMYCLAPECQNNSQITKDSDPPVFYHRIKDDLKWYQFCCLNDRDTQTISGRPELAICSVHFDPIFYKDGYAYSLIEHAFPTIPTMPNIILEDTRKMCYLCFDPQSDCSLVPTENKNISELNFEFVKAENVPTDLCRKCKRKVCHILDYCNRVRKVNSFWHKFGSNIGNQSNNAEEISETVFVNCDKIGVDETMETEVEEKPEIFDDCQMIKEEPITSDNSSIEQNSTTTTPDISIEVPSKKVVVIKKCPDCDLEMSGTETTAVGELFRHFWIRHGRLPDTPDICRECKKKLTSEQSCRMHYFGKHFDKNYKCDICGKTDMTFGEINLHKIIAHSKVKAVPDNNITNFAFPVKMLNEQNKNVIGCQTFKKKIDTTKKLRQNGCKSKKRPFSCEQCGNFFAYKRNLQRHMTKHLELLNHKCSHCKLRFRHKKVRDKHESEHVQQSMSDTSVKSVNTEVNTMETNTTTTTTNISETNKSVSETNICSMYQCSICGCEYEETSAIKKHFLKNHESIDVKKIKKFIIKVVKRRKIDNNVPQKSQEAMSEVDKPTEIIKDNQIRTLADLIGTLPIPQDAQTNNNQVSISDQEKLGQKIFERVISTKDDEIQRKFPHLTIKKIKTVHTEDKKLFIEVPTGSITIKKIVVQKKLPTHFNAL